MAGGASADGGSFDKRVRRRSGGYKYCVSSEDEWRLVLMLTAETVERAKAVRARALQARSRAVQARIEGEDLCAERIHAREALVDQIAARRVVPGSWVVS